MTLNEYQEAAMTTCMDTCKNPLYMIFNLQGEVGELSSKFAKLIRRGLLEFDGNQMEFTEKFNALPLAEINRIEADIIAEIGDILWQTAGLCTVLGYDLDSVGQANRDKLASRKQRGVIDGNGDNR